MKLRGEDGNQIQKRQRNRSGNGKSNDENEETLYWELSSSLSSGISPFLVVEKYFESFLLIFPSLFCNQHYSSSASNFRFPIPIPIPNQQNDTATLALTGEGEHTERRRSNSFPFNDK